MGANLDPHSAWLLRRSLHTLEIRLDKQGKTTKKIALIGPGIMSIPPKGWGAVEILIWDYYQSLSKFTFIIKTIKKLKVIIWNISF